MICLIVSLILFSVEGFRESFLAVNGMDRGPPSSSSKSRRKTGCLIGGLKWNRFKRQKAQKYLISTIITGKFTWTFILKNQLQNVCNILGNKFKLMTIKDCLSLLAMTTGKLKSMTFWSPSCVTGILKKKTPISP